MSIAVAVKKNGRTALAMNQRHHLGSEPYTSQDVVVNQAVKHGDAIIAVTHRTQYVPIIESWIETGDAPQISDSATVHRFFHKLWRYARDENYVVVDQCDDRDTPFPDMDTAFLVVTRSRLFHVSHAMEVAEFEKFIAVGDGHDFAIGAVYALYDQSIDASELALLGAKVAGKFNVYAAGPWEVMDMNT